ncbi:MAG: acetyltransferase [Cyanobacteria bacterium J083]|nr:MAG: acetyltransferase [Cyanobacteria bacterium J083]
MFLKQKSSDDLIEILEVQDLYDPFKPEILGRCHSGEEMQDPEMFPKSELVFPSGESLPLCWLDPDYKRTIQKKPSAVVN